MRNQDTLPSDLPWIQSDECLEMASTKLILDSIPCLNCDYDQQSPLLVEIQSRIKHRSVKKYNQWLDSSIKRLSNKLLDFFKILQMDCLPYTP